MLDAFEIRLADMVADALVGTPGLDRVGRAGAAGQPAAGSVGIAVRVLTAEPSPLVGDDRRDVTGPRADPRLRTTLHLGGVAALELLARPPAGQGTARPALVGVTDALLVALHAAEVRNGRAFRTDADQGFELDGFRLERLSPVEEAAGDALRMSLAYAYSGRFWPVETPAEGDLIETLATRMLVRPAEVPARAAAIAGGPDLSVPLRVDLRATGGAGSTLAARLAGASPPGQLVGPGGIDVPAGYTGFAIGEDGTAAIVYRPPGALGQRTEVRVEATLAHPDRTTLPLPGIAIEVLPS